MARYSRVTDIGIWGHYHGRNAGDDIVVAALRSNVANRIPQARFFGISADPRDTCVRHGMPSFPLSYGRAKPFTAPSRAASSAQREAEAAVVESAAARSGSWRAHLRHRVLKLREMRGLRWIIKPFLAIRSTFLIWRTARKLDLIIVAGSGPIFDDMGGPWVHPFNLFRWALLAKLAGTPFILMSVGAGPISHRLSRLFLRGALRMASYHSFRDPTSVDLARDLGARRGVHLFPDMAFSVPRADVDQARLQESLLANQGTVGVSTMAYMDPRYAPTTADREAYADFMQTLARFTRWLMDEGHKVLLLKSQHVADARTAEELIDILDSLDIPRDDPRLLNPPTHHHDELLAQMASCDLVVGSRFHCHILPFHFGIPVLGIAYHPKTRDMMNYMGQSEFCLNISTLTFDALVDAFRTLQAAREEARAEIELRRERCRSLLERQYDLLFGKPVAGEPDKEAVREASHG